MHKRNIFLSIFWENCCLHNTTNTMLFTTWKLKIKHFIYALKGHLCQRKKTYEYKTQTDTQYVKFFLTCKKIVIRSRNRQQWSIYGKARFTFLSDDYLSINVNHSSWVAIRSLNALKTNVSLNPRGKKYRRMSEKKSAFPHCHLFEGRRRISWSSWLLLSCGFRIRSVIR